jgi:kynurenine formamidase
MEKLIDLSYIIEDNMPVYPGDSVTSLKQVKVLQEDFYNNYRLDISMHSGTHIDSPMHLTESKEYIYEMPLETFIGNGCIIDVRNQPIIREKPEYKESIKENSIVLLYTGWDEEYGKNFYYDNHPIVDISLSKLLIEKNIKMLGIDMPSPDRYPFETHKLLFKNNICIMENLRNLDKLLGVPSFEVIAFPLKMRADSSMARVIARVL